jgi:predicted membrane channel-forming protein YqfA (hemolysin III family)
VYAAGWPERAYPGKFDLWFFSHPLMHVAATAAHVLEYAFVLEMAQRRRGGAALA